MGAPSAGPPGRGGWVRGPKAAEPAPPPSRPATEGDPTGTAGAAGRAVPHTSDLATPRTADLTAQRTAVRSAPQPRRRSTAPSPEPAWDEPRRPAAARGGSREGIGWVKAHGGAGVTSLVEVLGGTDVGARWPDPSRGEPRRVLLVGRTSARGLKSVSRALGTLHDGRAPQGVDLLAVVLVADAPGRLPVGLLRRIRVLRSAARVLRVPWIPAWRTGGTPRALPRQLDRLAELTGSELYGEGAAS